MFDIQKSFFISFAHLLKIFNISSIEFAESIALIFCKMSFGLSLNILIELLLNPNEISSSSKLLFLYL